MTKPWQKPGHPNYDIASAIRNCCSEDIPGIRPINDKSYVITFNGTQEQARFLCSNPHRLGETLRIWVTYAQTAELNMFAFITAEQMPEPNVRVHIVDSLKHEGFESEGDVVCIAILGNCSDFPDEEGHVILAKMGFVDDD